MTEMGQKKDANRFRLASSVDLSVAKNHNRCRGTGIVGYKRTPDPAVPGSELLVPIVCRCVVRRGGVKKDMFDRLADKVAKEMLDGTFVENLAADIKALPVDDRIKKVEELRTRISDSNTQVAVAEALAKVLAKMEEA
jgi:hypothetical protein